MKILYDFISKEILDPSIYTERVEDFLSLLLEQKVKILEILPMEGTRLADEYSILIMDMVVKLEDGKEGKAKKSCYRDIKDVYTIVLFETSPPELYQFKEVYMHHFEQTSDTGARMKLLQKYLFVTLDNFKSIKHNKGNKMQIDNRLEAWLAFMSMDNPEDILQVIKGYPEFKEIYEQIYEICRNLEGMMGMYSKELQELDRNSVDLMVDAMQKDLEQTREALKREQKLLEEKEKTIEEQDKRLEEKEQTLKEQEKEIEELRAELVRNASGRKNGN